MAFVPVILYLSLAVQIGLSSLTHSVWSFPALLALFGLQALLVRQVAGRDRFESVFARTLFCQVPIVLCLFYSAFWPVLSAATFLCAVAGVTLLFAALNFRKEISRQKLATLILLTLPFFLGLAFSPATKLIRYENEWRFLAEEGQMMGWVTKVLHGGIPYRDMIVTRGPLVIYTMAAALRLSQVDLVHARAWIVLLNLLMVFLYAFFCSTFFRSRLLGWCALLTMFFIHEISFRTGFALAALAFFWKGVQEEKPAYGVVCGITAALALLSSVDAAASAIAALALAAIAGAVLQKQQRAMYLRVLSSAALGGAIILAPIALLLAIGGGLGKVIDGMLVYPRYAMMGFAAAPFPNLLNAIRNDAATGSYLFPIARRVFALFYLPIFLYLFTFFSFLRAVTERKIDLRGLMLLTLALYGWFLFRSALGRSDLHHLFFSVPPAFALCFLYADNLMEGVEWKDLRAHRDRWAGLALACLLPVWFLMQRPQDRLVPQIHQFVSNFAGTNETSSGSNTYFKTPRLWGIAAPSGTQRRIDRVVSAIESQRKTGDRVYAFPNLPLYYFLLDTPNPTRYEWAYQAITSSMRREAVADLTRIRPAFVINSLDPHQRLDRIPARDAVPEIMDFLQANYKRWMTIGREEILVPKESTLRENSNDVSPDLFPSDEGPSQESGSEDDE